MYFSKFQRGLRKSRSRWWCGAKIIAISIPPSESQSIIWKNQESCGDARETKQEQNLGGELKLTQGCIGMVREGGAKVGLTGCGEKYPRIPRTTSKTPSTERQVSGAAHCYLVGAVPAQLLDFAPGG